MFDLYKVKVIKRVLGVFQKVNFVKIFASFDDDGMFLGEFSKYIPKSMCRRSGQGPVSENFPHFFTSSFVIAFADKTISSGGAKYNKNASELAAKGELLERVSSFAPQSYFQNTMWLQKKDKVVSLLTKKKLKSLTSFRSLSIQESELYYGVRESQALTYQKTTNGGAGHFVLEQAILGGWLELIQRDAFLMYWLNTISPRHISLEGLSLSETVRRIMRDLKRYNLKFAILDSTSDIPVPTVTCVVYSLDEGTPCFGLGAASGFDFEAMLVSALGEAVGTARFSFGKEPYKVSQDYKVHGDRNLTREKRLLINLDKHNFAKSSFFINAKETVSVEEFMSEVAHLEGKEPAKQLAYLGQFFKKRALVNKDYHVYYHQYANDLLNAFDYKVVKVICKALYQIYLNENFIDKHHPRLKEFVLHKGLEKVATLNHWPHPFP
jgi:thiazole/oxazole-forming peptide maturase SagD family component